MAVSSQHLNLKRWKRKFLGISEEGTDVREDVYAKAQKLINIFRQLSVLSKESVEHYNEMVLHISPDIRSVLSTLPCGSDVRGYISYLQERRGLPIEEDDEDDLEMSEGRKQAEIIAEAISKSTSKTAEQMQEQSMKQVEMLTKTLAEAQNKNASIEDITKITAAIQAAQSANPAAHAVPMPATGGPVPMHKVKKKTKDKDGKEIEIEVEEPIAAPQGGYYPVAMGAPLTSGDGTAAASAIGSAVADAIVKSQQQTSEIIAKMLGDAISKPQQVQNDSLKEISGMLAASQEKTANIILASVGDAISKPQQVQNNNIKEIAAMLAESNEKTVNAISTSIREAISGSPVSSHGESGGDTINKLAELIAASQDKTAKTILEALGSVMENNPESGGGLKEVAKMLTESQEKTASIIANSLATIASKEEKQQTNKQDIVMMMLETQEENSRILNQILGKLAEREGIKQEAVATPSQPKVPTQPATEHKEKPKELALVLEAPAPEEDIDFDTPLFGDFDESEFLTQEVKPEKAKEAKADLEPAKEAKPEPKAEPKVEPKAEPEPAKETLPEKQDAIAELKDTLEEIDDTIEPEFSGDVSDIPKNAPSSSDNQASDIDHDFEYEFYELDENGNLVPFDPKLNPDVEYEIVEDIEEGSDRLASFAKKEQLIVPDIAQSLEDITDQLEDLKEDETKPADKPADDPVPVFKPEAETKTEKISSRTTEPIISKIDFEGLFEEDYSTTGYDATNDYPSSWINNFTTKGSKTENFDDLFAKDIDLDVYEEENHQAFTSPKEKPAAVKEQAPEPKAVKSAAKSEKKETKKTKGKKVAKATKAKAISFAETKQLPAPVSDPTINLSDATKKQKAAKLPELAHETKALEHSTKALEYKPAPKTKAKQKTKAKPTVKAKAKSAPKVKPETVKEKKLIAKTPLPKETKSKAKSDKKKYWVKNKSKKTTGKIAKNRTHPFVIISSDDKSDSTTIKLD